MLAFYLSLIDNEAEKGRFEEVYYTYRKQMFALADSMLKNKFDAEDVVHDVFCSVASSHMDIITDTKNEKDRNRQYSSEAFYGCLFLSELYFSELTALGTVANNSIAFRGLYSLTTFYAPKLEEVPTQTFYNCISLKDVTIDSAHTIKDEAFYGCEELKYLYLPNVKYVGEDVFKSSAVENIFFGALEEAYSIPVVDSIIAIPSTATVIEENRGGAHLKIYGTKGTYAENGLTANTNTVQANLYLFH